VRAIENCCERERARVRERERERAGECACAKERARAHGRACAHAGGGVSEGERDIKCAKKKERGVRKRGKVRKKEITQVSVSL